MAQTKHEVTLRFFEAFERDDIDGALELTTDDVIVDRRNSNAPWGRAVSTGHEQLRADYREFRHAWDEVGGVHWESLRSRPVGGRLVVETQISGRGPSTGLSMDASGGWVTTFEGDLIREAVLFQSFDAALLAGRRRAIAEARVYFVCEARPGGSDPHPVLDAALRGGVEIVQLRDKELGDADLVAAGAAFREAADRHGALFFLNDRPDLVAALDADGVHVGQDDMPVAEARRVAGAARAVGLSTHSPAQFDAAVSTHGDHRPDQISVGPVWATPTKEGRPAAGLEMVRHAAAVGADAPWFAIGGIDVGNVGEVADAGARRIVVVRAIRDAPDPEAAARNLRSALAH
jgi:thiamine-phosphate pyrophosphorylase